MTASRPHETHESKNQTQFKASISGEGKMEQTPKHYFDRCLAGMGSCAKSSTAHGLNHVANNSQPAIRVCWLVAFAAGTCIFLLHFYTLLNRYFEEPVSTVIQYRAVDFQFPDVTLCTVLPFSVRALEVQKLMRNLTSITDMESPEMERLILLSRLPVDSFVLECSFFGKPCNLTRDFHFTEDPRYKHCYTFSPADRKAMSTVPQEALRIVAFAESVHLHTINQAVKFAIPPQWQSAGVRVIVHPPDTHPHAELRGVNVAPGTAMFVGLTVSKLTQVKACENREWIEVCDTHNRSKVSKYVFSKEDCYTERVQDLLRTRCGCVSDAHELPIQFCADERTPLCSRSAELKACYRNTSDQINLNFKQLVIQKCPYMCHEMNWHSSLYSTSWPSHFAEDQVVRLFELAHTRLLAQNRTSYFSEYIREIHGENVAKLMENLASVTVYPNSLTGNEEQQEIAYPVISLLGEVGGILGLWLGCSVLTFFEPIELFLHMVIPCCMRRVRRLRGKSRDAESRTAQSANSGDEVAVDLDRPEMQQDKRKMLASAPKATSVTVDKNKRNGNKATVKTAVV